MSELQPRDMSAVLEDDYGEDSDANSVCVDHGPAQPWMYTWYHWQEDALDFDSHNENP